MNQEFIIGNFKLIQDEDGYAVQRQVSEGVYQVIATFVYPLDALEYFFKVVVQAIAYVETENKDVEITYMPSDGETKCSP